ncbi:hypothetical protein [Duganella sp. Root336D2]|uniref:hypothetical protein n=1 Tax=Duganella sp. Root336D2 TaxID=1736518 RepID=UPI0006F78415|nr:hypothetical protein [Duganella sp. Root336D2]
MFTPRSITPFAIAALFSAGAAQAGSIDGARPPREAPSLAVSSAMADYRKLDADVSFTFAGPHIDSFASKAKPVIPDYAMQVLVKLGMPATAKPVRSLLLPSKGPIASRDLETNGLALPFVAEAGSAASASLGTVDGADKPRDGTVVPREVRQGPAPDPDRMVDWKRPDAATLALEKRAAMPILSAFLARHARMFDIDPARIAQSLRIKEYQTSPLFRKLTIEQYVGDEKVLYGRTLVHFDLNWNVIGISRMLLTPAKLQLKSTSADIGGGISPELAARTALIAPAQAECKQMQVRTIRNERTIDIARGLRVFDIESGSSDGECHWRTIVDAANGRILNVSDLVDRAYTDAQVNRWRYPSGNLFTPAQVISTGQYTRNDRRLEHDFFYMMNDHRCEGAAETMCGETKFASNWCSAAYGTDSGSSFIRATRRTDRDFAPYFPGGASETFGETNAYYWARQFSQWLKPSLDAMGVLPDSASDFPRVLLVSDACRSGSVHNSTFAITTDDNKGEGGNVIRLAHRDPAGASNHNASCEGGGCFDNPSNLHHELNHFFLKRYYDFGSDLDCGGNNQMKFIHEGALGTAVPQAFWQSYYGVGYKPSSTDKLYFSHSETGQVHENDASRMTVGGYLCVNQTTDQGPYHAGRVVGQALWEFYHGIKVTGATQSGTWRPTTDTDFNWIVYWAADLMAASTYKDRYEYANRFMEILDKHTNWSSGGKQDYCEIFQHHGLRDFINADYCN